MADASHLERMGRELKCPICLSLLNSAVSLSCNHVFCTLCIEKSMKAASSCPVCKVPYRRREIRPAPHMDNLVSVYKSMEVASGVNIFVTQTAASAKQSDEENQTGVNKEVQHKGYEVEALDSGNQKENQKKGSKRKSVATQRSSGSNFEKPSFPTKKRVQVPQYTNSGAEMEHKRLETGNREIDRNESKNLPALQKDMPVTCAQEEPIFSPFFWLREEGDLEKLSEQTDDNQIMYTPLEAPCFSDIKDSDDEAYCQTTPNGGTRRLSDNADFVDSEMFDWTQRPCSPELCSSPLPIQIEDTAEENLSPKKTGTDLAETTVIKLKNGEGKGKRKRMAKISDNSCGKETSNKKIRKQEVTRKDKRAKRTICDVPAVDTVLGKVTHQIEQEGNTGQLNLRGKSRKSKIVLPDASVEKNVPGISDGTEPLAEINGTKSACVSASEDFGKGSRGRRKLMKSGKNNKIAKKTLAQPQKCGYKVKAQKPGTGNGCSNTEQQNEGLISEPHTNLSVLGNDKDVSDRCIKKTSNEKSRKKPNASKKVKFSAEGISKDKNDGECLDANDEDAMSSSREIEGARDQLEIDVPAKNDKSNSSLNGFVLLKCNKSLTTFHCAFCQSSDESEASGVMVHYLNGKLVSDDHSAIASAVHVHKNCTEWAPNVYFEDDNVVNLEKELSRSRRIRCCCCGIKGASLGCYEETCRKSFHVTCARLTPECRWDYENFVMLCPIHGSSHLPNEIPQSQSRQKRKISVERKNFTHEDRVKTSDICKTPADLQWKSKKKLKNLVFCCSALTSTEKEIVTEFENLTGVTILKNWELSVTHVIASIDENGACRRTLKFLMGILEGKWILSVQWIKACIEAGEFVDEQQYEILLDIHGVRDGPMLGRSRLLNKQPKLFDGYAFYFMGDFTPSYKGYLHDLVIAAGGKVLNRKPVAGDQATPLNTTTFVIYSTELPDHSNGSSVLKQRRAQAEALAGSAGAAVASNSWIMNSIAGYTLQKVGE